MSSEQFTITKRVAKHGKQALVVIPKLLQEELSPGTVVEIKINVLREAQK